MQTTPHSVFSVFVDHTTWEYKVVDDIPQTEVYLFLHCIHVCLWSFI